MALKGNPWHGTASELRTYERAVALWRAAGMKVRGEKFVEPSLGARVLRSRWWTFRRAA